MKLKNPFNVGLMPNQPDIITNVFTATKHMASKYVLRIPSIDKIVSAEGDLSAVKLACRPNTIIIAKTRSISKFILRSAILSILRSFDSLFLLLSYEAKG